MKINVMAIIKSVKDENETRKAELLEVKIMPRGSAEILLRLDPETGKVNTVELVADDEKSQLDALERMQGYMKDIHEFSRKTSARAQLYRMLQACENEENTADEPRTMVN